MLGKKPVVLGTPSATPSEALPREPAGARSLLKPTVRDALTARRRESSVPATQTGARYDASDPALLSCWRLSPGYDDIVVPASGCDKKDLASLVTKRHKTSPVAPPSQREGRSPEKKTVPKKRRRRKPQAASLLSEALLTAGQAPHGEAAASGTDPCHKPEFTSETEEPEWEANDLPFKIDTVFSLATQEPQTDYPGMQEEEEEVGTEKKPIKVEEFCKTHSLTQDEMLDMCGSVFVVLERLDEKHMDGQGTRRTQPRCSDYCRKRTLNYLCMLDLIRCHPTKRRRIKMEEGQTNGAESVVKKEEPFADTAATGKEGGALKAAVKGKVNAAVEELVSAPASSKEPKSNIRPFASSFPEHDHPLKNENSGVLDKPVCTASLPPSTEQGKANTPSTSFRLIYCDPSSSATTTSPSSAWPATPGRILPNTSVVLEVKTSTLDRPSSAAVKRTTSLVSPSDDSAASSEAKASSSHVVHPTSGESRSGQRSPVSSGLSASGQRPETTTAPVREAETGCGVDSDVIAKKRRMEGGGSAEDTLADPTGAPCANPADVTAASPFVDVNVSGQVAGSGRSRSREVTTSAGKRSKRLASLLSPGPPAASAPSVTVPRAAAVTSVPASTVSQPASPVAGAPRSSPQLIVKYVAGPEGGRSTRSSSSTAAMAGPGCAAAGADADVSSTLLPGSQTGVLPSSLTPATVAAGPVPKTPTSVTTFSVPKTAGAKKRVVSIAPSTSAPSQSRLTSLVSMGAPPAATGKAAPGLAQLGGSHAQNVTVGATPPASSAYAVLIQDPQVAHGAPCLVFVGDPAGAAPAEVQNHPFSVASLSAPPSSVSSAKSVFASAGPAEAVAPCPATSATAAAATIARVLKSSGAARNSSSVASPAAPPDVVTLTNCNISAPASGPGTVGASFRRVYNPFPLVPPPMSPVSLTPAAVCVAAGYSVSRLMYVKPGDGHGSVMQDTLVRVVSDSRLAPSSAGLPGPQVKVVASPQGKAATVAPGSARVIPLVSGAEVRPVKTLPCVASRGQCVTPPAAGLRKPLPALQRAPGASPSSWSHIQVLPGNGEKAPRRESLVSLIKHPPTSISAPATRLSARRAQPIASTVGPQPRLPAQPFSSVSAATTGPLRAPGGDVPLTPCTAPQQTGARGPETIRVIVRPPASSGSGANRSATSSPLCVLIPKPGGRTLTLSKVSSSEVPASTCATTSAPSCPTSSAALPPERFHRTTTTGNPVSAPLPVSASSLLSNKAVAPCPSSTASAPTRASEWKLDTERTSTDNRDGDQGRRARFERKYPLPPGVVIKAEPVTFGYPTDAIATATPDDNGALSSPSTAAVSSASNAVTSSSPPQAPGPAGACTTSALGAPTADLDSADSSAIPGAGQAEPPAGGECLEPPAHLPGSDTADDSVRRGPPLDLDCPDLDMECDGGGAVYDEPPVLTPVSPLPGAEDNADISDPAQESVSIGQAHSSDARTPSSLTKLRQARPSRKKRKTSARATESQPLSSPSAIKWKPQAKSQSGWAESESCDQQELTGAHTACGPGIWTRPQSASLQRTSSDAGMSSVTSLSASSTSVVSAGPSTSSQSEATPSSSNDRIRRLKEMLKKQNEQLEEIRRQRSAHISSLL